MTFKYRLEPNTSDSHQSSAHWFAVIVRLDHIVTFDRRKIFNTSNSIHISTTDALLNPVQEKTPLILSNQIAAFSISSSKSSHTNSASFRVVPGQFRLDAQIHAGDHILFWAFDNLPDYQKTLNKVIKNLKKESNESANDFMDGLKFIGKLNAPKRTQGVSADGTPKTEYELTAIGFSEFDTKIYYTPAHTAKYQNLEVGFLAQVQNIAGKSFEAIDSAIVNSAVSVPTTSVFCDLWLRTFLGAGPGEDSKGFNYETFKNAEFAGEINNSLRETPNDIFRMPISVGRLLGVDKPQGTLKYYDLLNVFIGVQQASNSAFSVNREKALENKELPAKGFDLIKIGEPPGQFRAQYTHFNMISVWEIMYQYSNIPINDMYVGLRVNAQGKVLPTFVLRQNPLSSSVAHDYFQTQYGFPTTDFKTLPRWTLSNKLVANAKLGPSESLHYNYFQVQTRDIAQTTQVGSLNMSNFQNIVMPALQDSADIQRNGLKPAVHTLSCDIASTVIKVKKEDGSVTGQLSRLYTQFMTDIEVDSHLKWNGTIVSYGIQEPIALGDTLEYDEVVYMIESIVHAGHIDPMGRKHFNTTLQVTNGISVLNDVMLSDTIHPYETITKEHSHINYENNSFINDKEIDNARIREDQDQFRDDLQGANKIISGWRKE